MQKWEHEPFPPKVIKLVSFVPTPYSNHFGQRGLPPPKPQFLWLPGPQKEDQSLHWITRKVFSTLAPFFETLACGLKPPVLGLMYSNFRKYDHPSFLL